jgi:hypothetical protein
MARQLEDLDESGKYNFRPQINEKSRAIVEGRNQRIQRFNSEFVDGNENLSDDDASPQRGLDKMHGIPSPKSLQPLLKSKFETISLPKCDELYEEARQRKLKQDHIYSRCIDKECTFSPVLVTKTSTLSKNTVQQAKQQVRQNINVKSFHQEKPVSHEAIQGVHDAYNRSRFHSISVSSPMLPGNDGDQKNLLIEQLKSSSSQAGIGYDNAKNSRQVYLSSIDQNGGTEEVYDRLHK